MKSSFESLLSVSRLNRLNKAISNLWQFIVCHDLVTPFFVTTGLLSTFVILIALLIYFGDAEDNTISPMIESLILEESEIVKKNLSRPISQMSDVDVVKLTQLLLTVVKGRGLALDVDEEIEMTQKGDSRVEILGDTAKEDL